jgi:hypothetical protein
MRCVVVEWPYGSLDPAVVARNLEYADACMKDCLEHGESPYLSHLLYTRVWNDLDPEQRKRGLAAAQAWIRKADAVVVYTDRGISGGMRDAIGVAADELVPIEYRELGGEWRPRLHVVASEEPEGSTAL